MKKFHTISIVAALKADAVGPVLSAKIKAIEHPISLLRKNL